MGKQYEHQGPVSYKPGTRHILISNKRGIAYPKHRIASRAHRLKVIVAEEIGLQNIAWVSGQCDSIWEFILVCPCSSILFFTHIPCPHPSFHMLLSCGEGKESEYMKWGRQYEHLHHIRHLPDLSQQKGYSISKAGNRAHRLKAIVVK